MPKLLCPHCLQPLDDGYHGDCPHCGRTLENRNPEGALPFGTQLGGKYTVGAYLSADGDGLAYRGVLNDEKRFVLIKEYFPVTLCNGRSAIHCTGALTAPQNFIIKVSCTDIDALEHLLTKMQKMGSTNTQIILNTQLDRNLTLAE